MLSLQTIHPDTLELLKTLMRLPILKQVRLVGGTALALQYGHRRSIDLDLFGNTTEDVDELTEALHGCVDHVVRGNCTQRIKAYMLNGVKVDIVNYIYSWIDDAVVEEELRLASSKDIAAMKVNAVIGRGTKKDFIDVFFLLQHFSFDDLLKLYLEKYNDGSEYRALLSMTYFGDADPQPMPYMFEPVDWEAVKKKIMEEVEQYSRCHS